MLKKTTKTRLKGGKQKPKKCRKEKRRKNKKSVFIRPTELKIN